jgi:hypothetical protein
MAGKFKQLKKIVLDLTKSDEDSDKPRSAIDDALSSGISAEADAKAKMKELREKESPSDESDDEMKLRILKQRQGN